MQMSDTNSRSGANPVALAAEVARIKRDIPFNGSYREQLAELLSVLFFKFGERAGANRIAALLAENGRSPSTSTAQDEINKFWDRVRKNSTITIDRPDVPPALLSLLSDFAGKAWQQCMVEAQAQFDEQRQEVAQELAAARASVEEAQEQVTQARVAAAQAARELQVANESREGLGRQVAREVSKGEELRKQILELTQRLAEEKKAREDEGAQTQAALSALKASSDLAIDEQRRLMTVGDEFKQQAARERAQRAKAEASVAALASENSDLKKQLTALEHQRGLLEGTVAAHVAQIDQMTQQQAQSGATRPLLRGLRPQSRIVVKQRKLR